jgi:hypothetical protein
LFKCFALSLSSLRGAARLVVEHLSDSTHFYLSVVRCPLSIVRCPLSVAPGFRHRQLTTDH